MRYCGSTRHRHRSGHQNAIYGAQIGSIQMNWMLQAMLLLEPLLAMSICYPRAISSGYPLHSLSIRVGTFAGGSIPFPSVAVELIS